MGKKGELNKKGIYLDYNATTPVDPRALKEMLPYFSERFGNAASRTHPLGWQAQEGIEEARKRVANLIDAKPKEIVFTSGATESCNLAIKGLMRGNQATGNHIVTAKSEHKAVLDTCKNIEKNGGDVTYLDVDQEGFINLYQLEKAIREDTKLVAIMWANNETGVIQHVEAIAKICEEQGVILMSDATQAVGKIPVHPRDLGIGMMAFSSHKLYGPKGAGALFINADKNIHLQSQIQGGGHERALRSGTLNVPAIVGFGTAAELAQNELARDQKRILMLRDLLENRLLKIEASRVNGSKSRRLPNTLNIRFRGVDGERFLPFLHHDVAISLGSACTSANIEPSHVLTSMGLSEDDAFSSIRVSLGKATTERDIEIAAQKIEEAVLRIREDNPSWLMEKKNI